MIPRPDARALSVWVLAGSIVLYLSIDGGGYDVVVYSQAAMVAWWIVLLGAAWGLLPRTRPARAAWWALALLGGFVAWTALAGTWSLSSERSLAQLSLVAGYLGVLVLGIAILPDRDRALRHTAAAVATAIALVAVLALASRLRPGLFATAQQTSSFLPGTAGRLAWPLNYWNALAAVLAVGLPLLLGVASTARSLLAQAAAAAAVPVLLLCGYLTFSRGGALAGAAAALAFIVLAKDRLPKLLTIALTATGGAVLVAGAHHRAAIERGLANAAARHQGQSLLISVILVCAGVALVQVGIGLLARHATRPSVLVVSPRQARTGFAVAIAVAVAVALAAGVPGALSDAWRNFKNVNASALGVDSLSRFGTVSGNGRYDYWKVGVKATSGHLLAGSGPGTYQLLWLPRAPYESYVQNAHSLYVETLSEVGIVGLVLLVGFLALCLAAAVVAARSRHEHGTLAAGIAAAMVAFCLAAASDWIWQVPALPATFMLLAAAVLARRIRWGAPVPAPQRGIALRAGTILLALGCLAAIAVPLATATAVRRSQSAATAGDPAKALAAARQAALLEPGASSAQVQLALVEELQHQLPQALVAARHATRDEPANWTTWLVLSRLQAEFGHPAASVASYRRARSLNPRSSLFA
ncbi:MAG: O-antigen ligase family protein, partial [Actinomycetota bacterium]|nr:O-antigen ligase family protein [Actinomycetota bacterium]